MKKKTMVLSTVLVCVTCLVGNMSIQASQNYYEDKNNDGICDNQNERNNHYIDENQDGICHRKESCRNCKYIDENGDGICDKIHSKERNIGKNKVYQGKENQNYRNGKYKRCHNRRR